MSISPVTRTHCRAMAILVTAVAHRMDTMDLNPVGVMTRVKDGGDGGKGLLLRRCIGSAWLFLVVVGVN